MMAGPMATVASSALEKPIPAGKAAGGTPAAESFDAILMGIKEEPDSGADGEEPDTLDEGHVAEGQESVQPEAQLALLSLMQVEGHAAEPGQDASAGEPGRSFSASLLMLGTNSPPARPQEFAGVIGTDGYLREQGLSAEVLPLGKLPQKTAASADMTIVLGKDEEHAGEEERRTETAAEKDGGSTPEDLRPVAAATESTTEGESSPALQIISQVSSLGDRATTAPPGLASTQQVRAAGAFEPPPAELKALRIRLEPAELGDVEIMLRRVGDETRVLITVSSHAAAEQLGRDLSLLEDRLGGLLAQGSAQNMSVTLQGPEPGATPEQPQQGGGPLAGADGGSAGERDPGGSGKSAPDGRRSPFSTARSEGNEDDRTARSSAPGLRVV